MSLRYAALHTGTIERRVGGRGSSQSERRMEASVRQTAARSPGNGGGRRSAGAVGPCCHRTPLLLHPPLVEEGQLPLVNPSLIPHIIPPHVRRDTPGHAGAREDGCTCCLESPPPPPQTQVWEPGWKQTRPRLADSNLPWTAAV